MRQWQCPCGAWLDMSRPNHIHQVGAREPTVDEMIMARRTGREATALQPIGEISEVRWQPHFPRRDKPNE